MKANMKGQGALCRDRPQRSPKTLIYGILTYFHILLGGAFTLLPILGTSAIYASTAEPEHFDVKTEQSGVEEAKPNVKPKESRSEMLSRHQKEMKELQGKEIALKKAAAKGSKAAK